MNKFPPRSFAFSLLVAGFHALAGLHCGNAQILPLGFTNGTGTASVDQYTGIAGGGWLGALGTPFHSRTTNGVAAASSASPLTSGGGNYLRLNFDFGSNVTSSNGVARTSRRWGTSAISLSSPFVIEFDARSLVDLGNGNQALTFFGSSSSAVSTGTNDSWKVFGSHSGWYAYNETTRV